MKVEILKSLLATQFTSKFTTELIFQKLKPKALGAMKISGIMINNSLAAQFTTQSDCSKFSNTFFGQVENHAD